MKNLKIRATVSFSSPRIVGINAQSSNSPDLPLLGQGSASPYHHIVLPNLTLILGSSNIIGLPLGLILELGSTVLPTGKLRQVSRQVVLY